MPELPEVTTTVNGLQRVLPNLTLVDVWTDLSKKNQKIKHFKDTIKDESFFEMFKKNLKNKKIIKVKRRAKNILIWVEGGQIILIHLKMTGHLLYGKYVFDKKENNWKPDKKEKISLFDPYNRFIHVVFTLSNGKHMAFCDSRKFGKVTLISANEIEKSIHLKNIGPEPLDKSFIFNHFKERLFIKQKNKIKTILMDQSIIAGIGNIYSDEMLWKSEIHPESIVGKIPSVSLVKLFNEMKKVLNKGIDMGGDSMSDYRNIYGLRGNFQEKHNVYKRKGEKCMKKNCNGVIIRKVINGRSSHFCNKHQILFN